MYCRLSTEQSPSQRNETLVFAAVVEPKLLAYSSDITYRTEPVSVVVAEIVMQHVEERGLATCRQTIPLWLRYVDDTFTETRYLERVFHKNNYNTDFIRRNIYRPTEADATNRNPTPVTTVTIPYIKGTSETTSRILQPYNIRVPTNLQLRYDNY